MSAWRTKRSEPPLADTMRLMMPSPQVTLLLRASLGDAVEAARAWQLWRESVGDPKAFLASDRVGMKRHLPLLYHNLTRHGILIGRTLEPYLRAARAREEMRSTRYRRYLGDALRALRGTGVPFIVGKGVTVGETLHPDPILRHSHDIDLLAPVDAHDAASSALAFAGFKATAATRDGRTYRFDHESGLPVELHDKLYVSPSYHMPLDEVMQRAQPAEILGIPVRVMSDADMLIHAPVHASTVIQRRGLSWIVDTVLLLRRNAGETDFGSLLARARTAGVSLPLYATWQYLAQTFDVQIPSSVLDRLRDDARHADAHRRLAVIDGLRLGPSRRMKTLLTAGGWRSGMMIARDMILPPMAYLQRHYSDLDEAQLRQLYLRRPLQWTANQLLKARYRTVRAASRIIGKVTRRFSPATSMVGLLPEERLLFGCLRQVFTDADAARVKHNIGDDAVDWDAMLETATRHGVAPLIAMNLRKCKDAGLLVPDSILTRLRGAMFKSILTKEKQQRQLTEMLDYLGTQGLDAMLIKGAALDATVFQTPWHTVSLDIDVLIRQPAEAVPKSTRDRIYDFNGFGPFECGFASHHDLSINDLLPIDYDALWRDARTIQVQGRQVTVMCPEDMLIASCINAARKRFFQLKNLLGIRETIVCHRDLDWGQVAARSRHHGCSTIVYAALHTARLAVDAPVTDEAMQQLRVGPIRRGVIRALVARRSFAPITARHTLKEQETTIRTKAIFSASNLSLLLPYATYSAAQWLRRLHWLSFRREYTKPVAPSASGQESTSAQAA